MVDSSVQLTNSTIIQPSLIGKNVRLTNAVVGPYATIGDNCIIEKSIVENSIVQNNTQLKHAVVSNAMIGSYVNYEGEAKDLSIGDYTTVI